MVVYEIGVLPQLHMLGPGVRDLRRERKNVTINYSKMIKP